MICSFLISIWCLLSLIVAQSRETPPPTTVHDNGGNGTVLPTDKGSHGDMVSPDESSGGEIVSEDEFPCSEKGNCTCWFQNPANDNVWATCTTVGDQFDEIARDLPDSTTHLILRNNGITKLSPFGFRHFKNLQVLDLRDNNLTTPGSRELEVILGGLLKVLLDNNPLVCDCGITASVWSAEVTGTCASPPYLKGIDINTIFPEDFTCLDSCADLFAHGHRLDGLYTMGIRFPSPSGPGVTTGYYRGWCDMKGPYGGWLVLQQRLNTSVNFYRDWISYEKGFGKRGLNFWLGNRVVSNLTSAQTYVLRIEVSYGDRRHLYAEYDSFRLQFWNYTLRVGRYRGNLSDILLSANNSAFSTRNRDNDKENRRACAQQKRGAWWYGDTCDALDLNSMLGDAQGVTEVVMKMKPVKLRMARCQLNVNRIECGRPNITEEECLTRECCYDNHANHKRIHCFVEPQFVHFERLGCFATAHKKLTLFEIPSNSTEPPSERLSPVQACALKAWSSGHKLFAVSDKGSCLGNQNLSTILFQLNSSENCFGGQGGPNVSDVYRFTIFVSKLSGLRTSNVTFESVRVDWEPVPEAFILGYRVLTKNNSFSKLVAWNKSFITIDGLHSNSSYVIKVYPVHGLTDEQRIDTSPQSITVMTEIDQAPSQAPDVIIAYNSSANSLVLKWSHMSKQDFKGKPVGYNIRYYPVGLEGNLEIVTVNYTKNHTELVNLTVFTDYVINVSAVSFGGVGPGNSIIARTDDAAPTKAPNVITTRNSSSTSLRVKWSHVSIKHFNGKPVGYEITYYPVGLRGNISSMTVKYTTNYTELTNLTAFTKYIVNVSAVSSGGVGPGNWTIAQTDDAAPSKAPDVIIAFNSSSKSILLMWSHVSQQHFRGEPLGYLIRYYPVGLERNLSFVTVNYTANYAELINLSAFTEYVVNVSAVSSGGVGPGNWTTARTDDSAPDQAPDEIIAYNSSSTSLVVKWSLLSQELFNGKPIGYQIAYHPVHLERTFNIITVNNTENYAELVNLTVFTEYVITVSAVSSGGVGPGNTATAKTDDAAPSRAPEVIIAYNSSTTSLVVEWSHVPIKYFNGEQIAYRVSYSVSGLEDDWNSVTVNYVEATTELMNLSVYTEYAVAVSAVSSGGVGPEIKTFASTDKEGATSSPQSRQTPPPTTVYDDGGNGTVLPTDKGSSGDLASPDKSSGGEIVSEDEFPCSEKGNCTCWFQNPANDNVWATCTTVGDQFDEIARDLPDSTTHLILRNNGITKLSPFGFRHFKNLQVLDLRDNNLTTPGSRELQVILGGLLKVLLDNNPLVCDCGITASVWSAEVTGTCASPPYLKGIDINTIYPEDFTCLDSCADLFAHGHRLDGLYTMGIRFPSPSGLGVTTGYYRGWCDMRGPYGGWLVLQQRLNTSVNFYRDWVSYEKGFGKRGLNFWLGNRVVSKLTSAQTYVLRIEISYDDGRHLYAEYDSFRLQFWNYTLRVGRYRGNLSDILLSVNNSAFSTRNRDNDKVNQRACAQQKRGAWWYGDTCDALDLNSMLGDAQGGTEVVMKMKPVKLRMVRCQLNVKRIECGRPNITEEECLRRECCYDNHANHKRIHCFVEPQFVHFERLGCFATEHVKLTLLQIQSNLTDPPRERLSPVQACALKAWSRGHKLFTVSNKGSCLGNQNLSTILSQLNSSENCFGGQGGPNASDVYRFTLFLSKLSGLRTSNVTFESVRVDWEPVPEAFILGYRVLAINNSFNKLVAWNKNFITINGLQSNSSYVIKVYPVHGLTDEQRIDPSPQSITVTTEIDRAPTRAPNVIITRNSSATSLRVKWNHVSKKHFNGKPVGYEITYYPVGLSGNISSMTVKYTTNYTELTNLTAFTKYIVNVSAVSSGGVGPGNWTIAQTDDAAPSRAPDAVIATNTSSKSLLVKWSHVSKQDFNGEPIGYKVSYCAVGLERNFSIATVNYTTKLIDLTNLTAFTQYIINVSAVSSGGVGPGNTITARTDDTAPSKAPDVIIAFNSSSKSILLMWSHVSQQHFRGEPLGYLIRYYPVGLERSLNFVTVTYTANYAELTNLSAFTEYVVNVSAVSSGGVGPGNWTTARTDDSAPDQAPDEIIAYNSSSTSLVVKWSHLSQELFNGKPIGYQIAYHPVHLEMTYNSITVNNTENYAELVNLTVFTEYVITVSAVSSGGVGRGNTATAKTDDAAPSQTPEVITAYNSSSTSLSVTWSHLSKDSFHGKSPAYKITYHPVDLQMETNFVIVKFRKNFTELTNLTTFTEYVITVSAVSSGGVGPGTSTTARTDDEAPSRAPEVIIAYNSSTTSLVVEWSHVPIKYFNGEPIAYKVSYSVSDLEDNWNFVTVNYEVDTTELTNLSVYTEYAVAVSAVSSGGVGPEIKTLASTGEEAAPDQAPGEVSMQAVNETALLVSWRAISERSILSYKVYYSLAAIPDNFKERTIPSNEGSNVVIGDLNVYTLYIVRVSVKNSAGEGPKSAVVKARTMEGVPSDAPANVRVVYTDWTSIMVEWDSVPTGSENGVIQYYTVEYGEPDSYTKTELSESFSAVLLGKEDTLYFIQVAAATSKGVGRFSDPIRARTKIYDPCASSPCLNGGECQVFLEAGGCVCQEGFTGQQCETYIAERTCNSPVVNLPTLPETASTAPTIRPASQFLIESEVLLDCELSYTTQFHWNIYRLKPLQNESHLSRAGSSELLITRRLLPVGTYMVQLTVSMTGTQVFGVAEGYIRVVRSPLIAYISGGTKVERGFNKTLEFNASLSRDPDVAFPDSGLEFTWICRNSSENYTGDLAETSPVITSPSGSTLDRGGCYGTGAGTIGTNGSLLRIHSGNMIENSSYLITVVVRKDLRQATYTQEVVIVPGNPPDVLISCVDNCDAKLNPSRRLALVGLCGGSMCGRGISYRWSLLKASSSNPSSQTDWVKDENLKILIRTRLTSATIVTHPRVLAPDTLYKFVLTARRRGGLPGYSEYKVVTNSPPSGGTCAVSPQSGVTLATEFTFTCTNWQDVDLPLQYEFIYFRNSDLLNVVYKGSKHTKETKLPVGDKANNYTIDFRVRVGDMFRAFTEVKVPVQVLEPQLSEERLVDVVANLTTGDNSELNKLIQSGDLSRAVQLAKAAIVAVDDDKERRPVDQERLNEKRKKIKSSIVKQLAAVKVETVDRIQQTSDVIAEATSVISEVTIEAQKAATDALETMTSVLKNESSAGESFEALIDGARSLVTGLGSMLRVTSDAAKVYSTFSEDTIGSEVLKRRRRRYRETSRSSLMDNRSKRETNVQQSQAQKESKERAIGMLQSLDDVGSTVLSRTFTGEEPRELSSWSISLLLSREETDLVAGSVLSSKGGSFTLPSSASASLFGNDTEYVDSQVMTTDYVFFTWHPSGARVTTGVSSLELRNSDGNLIKIADLETPISIKLVNDRRLTNNSRSHFIGANRTVYHKINVTESGMALLVRLHPKNNGTELSVFVKYNERPTTGNSDFETVVPNFSSCVLTSSGYVNCSRDPYVVFVNSAHVNHTGLYFLGLQFKSKTPARSFRVKRCLGQGRSKRSCVEYKKASPMDGRGKESYHEAQYSKGDENYTMQVIPAACLYWSMENSKWTSGGCKVAEATSVDTIHCLCNHLSAFGGQLFVAPNTIDFDKVFTELTRLPETGNVAVIVAISCVFGLYLLLLVWARKADHQDALKIGEKPFLGDFSPWSYQYEIQLSTGIWYNSGTSANVFIILNGEEGSSKPYKLKGGSTIPFARGSITAFTLSLSNCIGPIKTVRVWHDNTGSNPSWFLNNIKILDMACQELKTFVCCSWLAVEKGDGLVDRTLTADANDEKTMKFKVSFQNRIAEEFGNGHLWFSVATRPPRKRFTRVQRLSCCLSLLLTTMLASAMFYEHGLQSESEQGKLRLGRLTLNLRELIVAVESLLLVIPINLLIAGIFTHSRSPFERQREIQRKYTVSRRLTIHRVSAFPIRRGCSFTLPHCFIIIGWILCFLSSVASATFVIFYSLQWGRDISEQWLISIVMSTFLDVFVSEPVKIVVIALLMSHFCNMSDFDEIARTPCAVLHLNDIRVNRSGDPNNNGNDEDDEVEIPEPPSKKQLQRARQFRIREVYMYKAIRKIIIYMIYLWIVITICYGGRSQDSYNLTSSVETTFGQLSKISSKVKTWEWMQEVLIPGLYEDNKDVSFSNTTPYIGDGEAALVGMPRLRQLRVKKDSCKVIDEAESIFNSCIAQYSFSAEDKRMYFQPRWRPFHQSINTSAGDLNNVCPKPWRYASAEETESLYLWGRLQFSSVYSQGGYLAELGYDRQSASKVVSDLSLLNWFDRFTSVVIVEFTVFNSRVSLFSSVWIPVEYSPSGHVTTSHMIRTMHVYNFGAGYSALLLVCQVLLFIFIVYFAFKEMKEMISKPKRYFSRFLNYIELAQILAAVSFIVVHIFKEIELFANTAKLHENIFQFISFDREVLLDDIESALLALLMYFNTFKLLYLFKFNSHVRHLTDVMKTSTVELINCSLGFFVFMFAFAHFGFLQFGREMLGYSTPVSSLQSLLIQGVVNSRVEHLRDSYTIIGPLFFIAFNLGLHFIWINIFIAILIYDYRTAKQVTKGRYSLGWFMMAKFKEMFSCLGGTPQKSRQTEQITQAANSRKTRNTGSGKGITWKLDDMKKDTSKKTIPKSIPKQLGELEKRMALMTERLNDLYVGEFSSDVDLIDMWLDTRANRGVKTEIRAGTHSEKGLRED